MRRALRLGVLALAVLLGVLCLLLAGDVRGWRGTIASAQLHYTVAPRVQLQLSPSATLPVGLSGSLLSVGPDQAWLRALQTFGATYEMTENLDALGPGSLAELNTSAALLTPLTQSHDAVQASQAYDLLAVVLFREAYAGSGANTAIISEAVLDLQNAVELDPANEYAKENLEIGLRTAFATHAAVKFPSGFGNHIGNKRTGGSGGPPGEGY